MYKKYLRNSTINIIIVVTLVGIFNFKMCSLYISDKTIDMALLTNSTYKDLVIEDSLMKYRPNVIIVGTSRVRRGISPNQKYIDKSGVLTYNLALPGSNIEELWSYIKYADGMTDIKELVIGLDLFSFNIYRMEGYKKKYKGLMPAEKNNGNEIEKKKAGVSKYFSMDTFIHHLKSIAKIGNYDVAALTKKGMWIPNEGYIEKLGGHRKMFNATIRSNSFLWFPKNSRKFALEDRKMGFSSFEIFRDIIHYTRENNIKLHLFISPNHAEHMEGIRAAGLWGKFERWKRELTAILHSESNFNGARQYQLWDFSGYNSITTEKVPELNDKETIMNWYRESSHYNYRTGDLVLDKIFNWYDIGSALPVDFGVLVDVNNVESHLAKIRRDREDYLELYPDEISKVIKIINSTKYYREVQ